MVRYINKSIYKLLSTLTFLTSKNVFNDTEDHHTLAGFKFVICLIAFTFLSLIIVVISVMK